MERTVNMNDVVPSNVQLQEDFMLYYTNNLRGG